MNPDSNQSRDFWERVHALYNEAAELSDDEQTAFLDRHCTDKRVRKELEALLTFQETSVHFFDSLSEGLQDLVDNEPEDSPPDTGRVGNYSIIEKIGRGGMGTVYLAERADESYESRVAIKILRRGLDSEDILARFHIERQILARLNHPNITHLLDGGLTSDGRPYFVMEYVEGVPLTRYCDEQQLTLKQRLKLFFQVCDALQYAHKNLVIHRDLKPGNILVTAEGQVKLLDFGIAKLLDNEADTSRFLARTGLRVMTPEYASPEQVRGHTINTASDVYQLGLVLYELLCGHTPFFFPDRSLLATERVILEEDPVRPSQRIDSSDEEQLKDICSARSATPKQLKRDLKGDLDAIILKALNKESDRRFSSVAEMKEEIASYLNGLPVKARSGNFRYKAGKYLQRNRKTVSLVSVFVFLLLLLGILYSRSVTHERNIALREAARSEQIKDFMVDLIQSLDPSEIQGEPFSPALLLDRSARQILDNKHQDQEVRGELLLTLSEVYETLGLRDQSQELLTALFDHIENNPGDWDLLEIRGRQHQAFLYGELGDYEASQSLYKEVKSDLETHFPGEKMLIAGLYSDYALTYRLTGEFERSDSLFQIALRMHEDLYEPGHPDLTRVQSRHASLLTDMGRNEEAKHVQEEVLRADREYFGNVHRRVLRETNNLATTSIYLQEYSKADSLFTEAQALSKQLYGGKNLAMAMILNNHGNVKSRLGHYEEALEMFGEVLQIRQESGVYEHPSTGFTTISMCSSLLELERFEEAHLWAERSFELLETGLPQQHWLYDFARVLLNKADFRLDRFNPDMLETVRNSYENLKMARGIDDDYTQRALSLLTELYTYQGQTEEAEEYKQLLLEPTTQ